MAYTFLGPTRLCTLMRTHECISHYDLNNGAFAKTTSRNIHLFLIVCGVLQSDKKKTTIKLADQGGSPNLRLATGSVSDSAME